MKQKEKYEAPRTACTEVELESGLLSASVFDPENRQDNGVSIEGHEVGTEADYTNIGWDDSPFSQNN